MRTYRFAIVVFILILAFAAVLAACSTPQKATPTTPASAPTANTTSIDAAQLLNTRCTACHTLSRVQSARQTQAQWTQTVNQMISKGAQLNADEKTALIDYLAKTYHP